MKVPPRASYWVQVVAALMGAMVQVGVKTWLFTHIPDMCAPDQKDSLTCPQNGVYFTASAIWGLIGPTRQFGNGTLYHGHLFALIAGAFLPVPIWLWQRYHPKTSLRYINIPVMLNGPTFIPPARGINYSSWFVVGFIFRTYFFFNCIGVGILIRFNRIRYPKKKFPLVEQVQLCPQLCLGRRDDLWHDHNLFDLANALLSTRS
jgi:OPT oligopeptide transporter protein